MIEAIVLFCVFIASFASAWYVSHKRSVPTIHHPSASCYLVVHQKLRDGVLTSVRVGLYSTSAQGLTNMGGELNSDVLNCEEESYEEAREHVMSSLNYKADLGVAEWVVLRDLLHGW